MVFAIEIEGLGKKYGHVKVVTGLSLSVPAGQVLGLLGLNGAGKTTVLKLIAGLLSPDTGRVRLNGYDLACERHRAMQQVEVIVQGLCRSGSQCPAERLSVWENLHHRACERDERLLRELDLWARRDDPVNHLSFGLQRRVVLAAALSADRPILLLDEPTHGLDARATHTIRTWVRQLAGEQGKTVVVATRCWWLAQELCDRVVVLQDGHLVADMPICRRISLDQPAIYQIRVRGNLDTRWAKWFGDLMVTALQDETIITGLVADQPALHGLLIKIRDLGLPLLSVYRIEPELKAALAYHDPIA